MAGACKGEYLKMRPRQKRPLSSFIIGCLAILFFQCHGSALASSLSVQVRGTTIDIQADEVPLIEVLQAISEKTGISLKADESLSEPVSLVLNGTSVEKCIRRLLAKRDYTLLFVKDDQDRVVPVELQVVGGQTSEGDAKGARHASGQPSKVKKATSQPRKVQTTPSPPEDPMKRFGKAWFERAVRDTKRLSQQVTAGPTEEDLDVPGLRITRVSRGSVFHKVGLRAGDVIHNVNGQPVNTVEEFIEALQSATEEQPMIRIEGMSKDGQMHPIYIELLEK
jgi:hypothetical protein